MTPACAYPPQSMPLGGISPPISGFVKGKPSNNKCFYLRGINHKKFVTLNGNKPLCTA
jgi:hypothetical protein